MSEIRKQIKSICVAEISNKQNTKQNINHNILPFCVVFMQQIYCFCNMRAQLFNLAWHFIVFRVIPVFCIIILAILLPNSDTIYDKTEFSSQEIATRIVI